MFVLTTSSLPHCWRRGSHPRITGVAKHAHWADETRSSVLVPYAHSMDEEDTVCHTGPQGGCAPSRVNNQGLWTKAGLVAARRWSAPGSPRRLLLAYLNNSMDWQGTETHYSQISRNASGPLEKEDCLVWGSYLSSGEQWGGDFAVRPFKALSIWPDVKAAHMWILGPIPHHHPLGRTNQSMGLTLDPFLFLITHSQSTTTFYCSYLFSICNPSTSHCLHSSSHFHFSCDFCKITFSSFWGSIAAGPYRLLPPQSTQLVKHRTCCFHFTRHLGQVRLCSARLAHLCGSFWFYLQSCFPSIAKELWEKEIWLYHCPFASGQI